MVLQAKGSSQAVDGKGREIKPGPRRSACGPSSTLCMCKKFEVCHLRRTDIRLCPCLMMLTVQDRDRGPVSESQMSWQLIAINAASKREHRSTEHR